MHLNASNFYGGPEKQIVEHLTRLNKDRFGCILASFFEGSRPNEILHRAKVVGLKHFGIPMSWALDFTALLRLIKLLRKKKVSLLCTHGYKPTIMGWWAARRVGIPIIAFSRGYTSEDIKVAFYERLEQLILRMVNGIICVSKGHKRRLNTLGIYNPRSWVVHNAVSVNENRGRLDINLRKTVLKRLGLSNGRTIVVSAGRLSPEKGHRFIIEAISILGEKTKDTYFVFCGEGAYQKKLERQAQELKVAHQCCFPGFRRDLDQIFRVMDFMVLPSLTEGLPNVVLEAFSYEKTVVATAVGGVPELVEDGVNGLLVPPGRADLLAEAIASFLTEPTMMDTMGKAGYRKIKSDFTFESQTQKLENIYHQVLAEHG